MSGRGTYYYHGEVSLIYSFDGAWQSIISCSMASSSMAFDKTGRQMASFDTVDHLGPLRYKNSGSRCCIIFFFFCLQV